MKIVLDTKANYNYNVIKLLSCSATNKEIKMIVYHASNDSEVKEVKDEGVFGGVFASSSEAVALSHGEVITEFEIDEDDILTAGHFYDSEIYNNAIEVIKEELFYLNLNDESIDIILNAVTDQFDADYPQSDEVDNILEMESWDAGWKLQYLLGAIAKKCGFKAAEMRDEHGTVYLINSNINQHN